MLLSTNSSIPKQQHSTKCRFHSQIPHLVINTTVAIFPQIVIKLLNRGITVHPFLRDEITGGEPGFGGE